MAQDFVLADSPAAEAAGKFYKGEIRRGSWRISADPFNDCPGRASVREAAEALFGDFELVNLPDLSYWTNDFDTLVLSIPDGHRSFSVYEYIELLADRGGLFTADEVDCRRLPGGRWAVRLWWD